MASLKENLTRAEAENVQRAAAGCGLATREYLSVMPLASIPRDPPAPLGLSSARNTQNNSSFFSRVFSARQEAQVECDASLALQLSRQLAVEERRQADAQLAEDARLARELSEMLEAKAAEAEAADAAYAHALQSAEATALINRINSISATWKAPDITARNAEGGIIISMKLPCLDVKTVRVRFDATSKEICITARPDLSTYYEELTKLPKEMRTKALAITLDLKVVGKERYQSEDLEVTYVRSTELCTVMLRKAFLKEKSTASPLKVVGRCLEED